MIRILVVLAGLLLCASCVREQVREVRVPQVDGARCTCDASWCTFHGQLSTCMYCSEACSEAQCIACMTAVKRRE